MSDEKQSPENQDESSSEVSRREFVAISLGVGLAAGSDVSAAALDVVESNVQGEDTGRHVRRRLHSSH